MKANKNRYSHSDLVRILTELVHGKKSGDRLETDRELAARYGVSNVTIRAAMIELVGAGLVVRRQSAGTYVADMTDRQHVAIVVSQDILRSHRIPFIHCSAMSIMNELDLQGQLYHLYMIPIQSSDRENVNWPSLSQIEQSGLVQSLERNEIRAIVHVGIGMLPNLKLREGIPFISLSSDPRCHYRVELRREDYIRYAVRYLVNFGRTRFSFLSWFQPQRRLDGPVDVLLESFKSELERHGLSFYDEWVNNQVNPTSASCGWRGFQDLWNARGKEKPDALICADDLIFNGVASAVLAAGVQVPSELQIVTTWNKDSGILCPFPVARYEYDPSAIGGIVHQFLKDVLAAPQMKPELRLLDANWCTEGQMPEDEEAYFSVSSSLNDSNDALKPGVRG